MRLPKGKRLGVQTLGREDIGAPAREWEAEQRATEAMADAIKGSVAVVGQIYQTQQEEGARDRALMIKKDLDVAHMKANTHEIYDMDNMEDRVFIEGTKYRETKPDGSPREAIPQDEVMAQAWVSNRDRIMKDNMDGMSRYQQNLITENLTPHINQLDINTQRNSIVTTAKGFRNRTLAAADDQVKGGDINTAVQIIAEAPYFDDETKAVHIERLRVNHETQEMDAVIYGDDPQAIVDLLVETEPDNYQGVLDPRKLDAYRDDALRSYGELTAEQTAAEEKAKAKRASDLEIGVSRGNVGYAAINRAYEAEDIPAAKRTQLFKMADQASKKAVGKSTDQQTLSEFMQGNGTYNPTNPAHKKMTENAIEGTKVGGDIKQLELLSHSLGYVPKFLKDKVEGDALRGDGRKALEIYTRMFDGKPQLLSQIHNDAKSILNTAAGYVRAGAMDPGEAISLAREIQRVPPEQRESRRRDYSKVRALSDSEGNLSSLETLMGDDKENLFAAEGMLWGDSPFSEVTPNRQQLEEFEFLTQTEFVKTGDINTARRNAYALQRSTWGTSGVGMYIENGERKTGRRSAKYSPERVLNQTTDQIQDTLSGFAMAHGLDPEFLILKDTPNTARGVAEWRVYDWDVETQTPVPLLNTETNRPLLFNATEYEGFKMELMGLHSAQEAAKDIGRIDEEGNQTAWAVRKLKGNIDAQGRIDNILEGMVSKPKDTQYLIAERIVGNKNASPDQIQQAKEVMDAQNKTQVREAAVMPNF